MMLGIVLVTALGLACAQLGVAPSARFKIDERFPDRIGEAKVLGVEVTSALPSGSVSESDLKRLSGFFTRSLTEGSFDAAFDLTSGGHAGEVDLILTVDITLLEAATPEERKKRVPSHLHGTISLRDRATGRNFGRATIWATGSGLDLKPEYMPDTVRKFIEAIRGIVE
jgi:hypothetical protein